MNKKLLIGLMLLVALSGCGKKKDDSKEEKKYICVEIKDFITKYESGELSFKDFKSSVSSKYNEICSKDMTEVCQYIGAELIDSTDIALSHNVGCDIFDDQEMKNNCLQSSDITSYLEPFVGTSQVSVVSNIKVKCNLANNEMQ
jgi:hypothetical protein